MTTSLDARAIDLFRRVLDAGPAEREAALDTECAGDGKLRARVRALLDADEAMGHEDAGSLEGGAELVGSRVGRFRIVRLLGSGGMGTVYEAEQDNPRRSVALKIMRPGTVSRAALKRFEYESQILARLRHPGIAQVHEAGTHGPPGAEEVPYFAMEFVEGARTIVEFCSDGGLDTRRRLELFAQVCDAVHHGHQKGVIHRDLKPGNILVDGSGQPKIIDFGIARATDSDVTAGAETGLGQLLGTLRYMSPEQCEGDPHALDIRSDVYALGVVLYELLTGMLPYEFAGLPVYEAPRVIREARPRRLSSANRALRGDLETIVLKALEKDREQRYASAAEFGADLRRFLGHEPIMARPPSAVYQMRMFARRNTGLVAGIAATIGALAVGLAAAVRQTARARTAEARVVTALDQSQRQAYIANIAAADGALHVDDGGTAAARLAAAPAALRGWEWRHLMARADRSSGVLRLGDKPLWCMAVDPKGIRVLITQGPRGVTMLEGATGAPVWERPDLASVSTPFSRDGTLVAGFTGKDLVICDAASGLTVKVLRAFEADMSALSVCFHPDGRRLAVSDNQGNLGVWDWREGRVLHRDVHAQWVWDAQFSPDGGLLAYVGDHGVRLLDTESWTATRELAIPPELPLEETRAVRFSPDGAWLAVSRGPIIRVWEVRTGALRTPTPDIPVHTQRIFGLAFSPDGATIASVSADRTLRLTDAAGAAPTRTLVGHASIVGCVAFLAGGSRVVTSSADNTLRFWDVPPKPIPAVVATPGGVPLSLGFLPGGDRLLYSEGGGAAVLDVAMLKAANVVPGPASVEYTYVYALSPDGKSFAGHDAGNELCLWDTATGRRMWGTRAHQRQIGSISFSSDGRRLASCALETELAVWDAASGAQMARIDAGGPVHEVWFQPGSGLIAARMDDGSVTIWDSGSGMRIRTLTTPGRALSIAFSGDGKLLAVGTGDGVLGVWETADWKRIAVRPGMQPEVWSLAFSPEGARLAAGSKDRAVHILDTSSWNDLLQLRGHTGTVVALAWSTDGRRLASASADRSVRIWDAPPVIEGR